MKTVSISLLAAALFPLSSHAESVVKPTVESVSMFKNGLALVVAKLDAGQAGEFVWSDPPAPVHGTFFVEGPEGLTVRTTVRSVPAPADAATGNLQTDLAGCRVTVFRSGRGGAAPGEMSGTVWTPPPPEHRFAWNRQYESTDGAGYSGYWNYGMRNAGSIQLPVPGTGTFLIVEGGDGLRRYIASGDITEVRRDAPPAAARTVEKPVLVFQTPAAGALRISYLTKGMAWVPSYQVELKAADRLRLRLSALVKNELMDLSDVELRLISGFPGIRFAHVDSPLAPGVTLSEFFSKASQEGGARGNAMSQQMLFNNARMSEGTPPTDLPPAETGPGVADIHYQSIGKHSLAEGDVLGLDVASGDAPCERVVEWKLPDYRDDHGRVQNAASSGRAPDESDPWDAVQFMNPLKMPMTTAAATISENGRFTGQSMAGWTPPGQPVVLRITKALTIHTENSEREEEGQREIVFVAGDDYRRTKVKGELTVRNDRTVAAKILIRGQFSGDLIEAEGEPAKSLRKEGVSGINPRRELHWTVTLQPGESRTLKYRYSVMVPN